MPTVQPFNRKMIENHLKSIQVKYLTDSDGDFVLPFGYDDDWGRSIRFLLMVQGEKQRIYTIVGIGDKRIPKNQWGQAMLLCNTWNEQKRWPKVYLDAKDSEETGVIVAENQISLEQGIHQELLSDITATIIAATMSFWKWMHKEKGF